MMRRMREEEKKDARGRVSKRRMMMKRMRMRRTKMMKRTKREDFRQPKRRAKEE